MPIRKKRKKSRNKKIGRKKPIIKIVVSLLAVILVYKVFFTSSDKRNPNWIGWVYPDKSSLSQYYSIGYSFTTLQDCRVAAQNDIYANRYSNADYECGHMCRYDAKYDIHVCKETSR